jgi:hypothetical protein
LISNFVPFLANFQIEGRWEITPTANVYGVPGGFNNLTYVGTAAQNTLVLAGSFNSITFFANTTTGNYWTTGTFTNCNAYLTGTFNRYCRNWNSDSESDSIFVFL